MCIHTLVSAVRGAVLVFVPMALLWSPPSQRCIHSLLESSGQCDGAWRYFNDGHTERMEVIRGTEAAVKPQTSVL